MNLNDCGSGSHTLIPALRLEVLSSSNSLANTLPTAVPLQQLHGSPTLAPNESLKIPLMFHVEQPGTQEIAVLLVFRKVRAILLRHPLTDGRRILQSSQHVFYSSRLHHSFDVVPILDVGASARPTAGPSVSYMVNVEVRWRPICL